MKPSKPDWYGRLQSGPFSERTFGRAHMARVEERLRRGDGSARRGTRWVAWGFGAAAACVVGALLLVKVAGIGPQPAVTVSPPPGTTAVSPAPTAAPSVAPQITEGQAVQIVKKQNSDPGVQWTATLDPAYKSSDLSLAGPIMVWRVEGLYPAGNKDVFIIDAATGTVLANNESEAPPLLEQAKKIEQMRMLNESHGWSINADGVWHTATGPTGWTKVTPQGISLADAYGSYVPPRMAFVDDSMAVLAIAQANSPVITVYRTVDSGKTWSSSSFKSGWTDRDAPMIRELTFVDRTHGWMLLSYGVGAGSEQVGLYATSDGGASWRLTSGNEPGKLPKPNEIPHGGDKSGIAFADAKHGYLTGYSAGPGPYLYGTSDGGTTWNPIKLSLPNGIDPYGTSTLEPVFVTASDGWLVVPYSSSEAKPRLLIYRTVDGGSSWAEVASGEGFAQGDPIRSFVDAKTVFLTDGTQWYKIGEGGSTTSSWTLPDNRLKGIRSLQFLNDQIGYAVMDTRVWMTRDGGHTWNMAW